MILDFAAFALLAAVYIAANRPFLRLTSHQDAGWHAYWAAFRRQGVTLRFQENVLMGCTRLGCAFLFALWIRLFGGDNPERLGRLVALVFNIVVAAALVAAGPASGLTTAEAGWLIGAAYLLLISLPTLAVHYESAERTVNFFDVFLLLGAALMLPDPQPGHVGGFVFLVVLLALLFKVTQLAPYGLVWVMLFAAAPALDAFLYSAAGCLGAGAVFALILRRNDLLHRENLGIFGYAGHNASAGDGARTREIEDAAAAKFDRGPLAPLARGIVRKLGGNWSLRIYGVAQNARTYLPMVLGSLSSALVMAGVGLLEGAGALVSVAGAWLAGAAVSIVAQGRFFPFHCISAILPLAILAGTGWSISISAASAGATGYTALIAVAAALQTRDLVAAFRGRAGAAFDYRFWPSAMQPVLEKNLLAKRVAAYVKERSSADDYVLVLGTLPQFYLLCARRCPINWLSTNDSLMAPILPDWKERLMAALKTRKPRYVLSVDAEPTIDEIAQATGDAYRRETGAGDDVRLYVLDAAAAAPGANGHGA